LNKWLAAIAFSVLLLVPVGAQNAFANDPPPIIKFVEVDSDGCKIFKITDMENRPRNTPLVGKLTKLNVFLAKGDGTETFSINQTNSAQVATGPIHWEWLNDPVFNPTTVYFLKACPGGDDFAFSIIVEDQGTPDQELDGLVSSIDFIEKEIAAGTDGSATGKFEFVKTDTDCAKIVKEVKEKLKKTNVENVEVTCKKIRDKPVPKFEVTITGSLIDGRKPGSITSAFDPHQVFNVMQLNICVIDLITGNLICPTSVPVNLILEFASHVIGGTILPLDSTSLILAGLETSALWLAPVVISAAGIGLFVVSRKSK